MSVAEPKTLRLDATPAATLAAVAVAAEDWGARWSARPAGGRLELPVTAGIRRGGVAARLEVEKADDGGSSLRLEVEGESWRLHRSAVFILVMGGAGAAASTLWPFFPDLLAVAPLGVVLALAAWLLVASRLRNAGPEEFLELVRWHAEGEEPGAEG